eukprot:TRINITY_DN20924_c0_g1_i1.p1 TRINITY_DN20924_c0_g1~~TRINITY_DN20924_c0_g1_i1.p1  ORF type:complete len:235 (+),score=66.71 TRINITY_DN20924_c0_g1_i1:56-760(+)
MSDLTIIEESKAEVSSLCNEVEKDLATLKSTKSLQPAKRAEKISVLKNRIARAKQSLRGLKVELREMPKVDAKPHLEKALQLEDRINALLQDVEWYEKEDPAQAQKEQLLNTDYKEVINKGKEIQMDDISTLTRVIQQVNDTEVVGRETLVKLSEQKDQIISIDKGVSEVESNIKLANKHLRVLVRRLATDKIIMCFVFLIVAGVIFIIVWSATHPKLRTNIPDSLRVTTSTTG